MSITVNSHPFEGTVIAKSQMIPLRDDMKLQYLYCSGVYMINGKEQEKNMKFCAFSWGGRSKLENVYPGDKVGFTFSLSGLYDPTKKDKRNCVSCWTEIVIQGKVEILDDANRRMYNNEPKTDDLGVFPEAKPVFKHDNLEEDDATQDLPF